MSCELPKVYQVRTLHDDWLIPWLPSWIQPWALIPRRWTGHCFPMPPKKIAGTAPIVDDIFVQPGYPLAPGTIVGPHLEWNYPPGFLSGPGPVPPLGTWSLQAVWSTWFNCWIPCYFAASIPCFGRRLLFSGPLKPDTTLGDQFWWFEFSLSWTVIK